MSISSCVKNISLSDEGVCVTFPSGRVYRYPEADKNTVIEVLAFNSLGEGFNAVMRNMESEVV